MSFKIRILAIAAVLSTSTLLTLSSAAFAGEVGRVTVGPKKSILVVSMADEKFRNIPLNKIVSLRFHLLTAEQALKELSSGQSEGKKSVPVKGPAKTGQVVKKAADKTAAGSEDTQSLKKIEAPELKGIELISFDAVMPAHGHGMVVKPKVILQEFAVWQVDGVKLHMKGDWEIRISLKVGEGEEKFVIKYSI